MDDYFDFYFQFHPTAGTQAGFINTTGSWRIFHARRRCGNRGAIEISESVQFELRVIELSQESAGDLEILTSSIQGRLLELQSIQMWRKDPDVYIS